MSRNEAQTRRDLIDRKIFDRARKLDHEIASVDAEIDSLVYELYGLTEEEIKIVEGEKK